MRIAYLAPLNVIHTIRWVNAFADRGHDVHLITMADHVSEEHRKRINAPVHILPFRSPWGYYLNTRSLKQCLGDISPDLLHTHFASGYGTLARFSQFSPNILSVWGSDIYIFPKKSRILRNILIRNIMSADRICSTSHAMAAEVKGLCPSIGQIPITPFGIDTERFVSQKTPNDSLVIGTVKTLRHRYGIDILLRAFAQSYETLCRNNQALADKVRLMIVGGGPDRDQLEQLARALGISSHVTFTGAIPHEEVPRYLNLFDIYVAVSRSESFGVAVLEASACGLPVIVSNVGGLPEVVDNERTGIIVESENVMETSQAMLRLLSDAHSRQQFGESGRHFVCDKYSWERSVTIMSDVYSSFAK